MKLKSKSVLHYFFEVVAIVLGITISFIVDEYREESQEHDEYIAYLTKMQADLRTDSLMYEYGTPERDMEYHRSLKMYNVIYRGDTLNDAKKFIESMAMTFRSYPIITRNNTFKELQSSGKLRLIKNDSIRMLVLFYYDSPTTEVWNATLKERNYLALDKVVNYLPLEILLQPDSTNTGKLKSRSEIDYALLKIEVINSLRNEPGFEGLFKNAIRTLENLAVIQKDYNEMNALLLGLIEEELARN